MVMTVDASKTMRGIEPSTMALLKLTLASKILLGMLVGPFVSGVREIS